MSRPICYDLIDKVLQEVGRMKRKQEKRDRIEHEDNLCFVMSDIEEVGDNFEDFCESPYSDQFFEDLYRNETLDEKVISWRRNQRHRGWCRPTTRDY